MKCIKTGLDVAAGHLILRADLYSVNLSEDVMIARGRIISEMTDKYWIKTNSYEEFPNEGNVLTIMISKRDCKMSKDLVQFIEDWS